jgi:hypothetical protein
MNSARQIGARGAALMEELARARSRSHYERFCLPAPGGRWGTPEGVAALEAALDRATAAANEGDFPWRLDPARVRAEAMGPILLNRTGANLVCGGRDGGRPERRHLLVVGPDGRLMGLFPGLEYAASHGTPWVGVAWQTARDRSAPRGGAPRLQLRVAVAGERLWAPASSGILRYREGLWPGQAVDPEAWRDVARKRARRMTRLAGRYGTLPDGSEYGLVAAVMGLGARVVAGSAQGLLLSWPDWPWSETPVCLLVRDPQNGRLVDLRVPPRFGTLGGGSPARRVREALAWTFDIDPDLYEPTIER